MAGLYIHVPFCRQACHYCNFHFSVSQRWKGAFVEAVLKEMEMQRDFFVLTDREKPLLETIYFGGGTPSLLSDGELRRLMEGIMHYYSVNDNAEITLEANPDDLTPSKLDFLRAAGINRLSIGIQSFHANDLVYMNRSHTSQQAMQVLDIAQKAGFKNITVDLIYGTPGMADSQWEQNFLKVAEMGIPHISAYSLTVEKQTALDVFIKRGKLAPVDDEQAARQFQMLCDMASEFGYEHYEISNFGYPGFFSQHNLGYWSGKPYLGLGPSAHSYKSGMRQWNISNTTKYIQEVMAGKAVFEREILTKDQQFNEYVMTALRTMWGIDKSVLSECFGYEKMAHALKSAQKYLMDGRMEETSSHIKITPAGKFFADGIAAELFL